MNVILRFCRYQAVGAAGFLLDLGILYLLIARLDMNYLVATTIGFLSSVVFGFFFNRAWSFKKWVATGRIAISLGVALASLAVILFVTYICVENIHLPYLEARLSAAIIAAIVSYIGDALLTFQIEPFK